MLPVVLSHLREHVDPWLALAGGATDYVEVGTTIFAVVTTDCSVTAAQMAHLLAKHQPSDSLRAVFAEHARQRRHECKGSPLLGTRLGAQV